MLKILPLVLCVLGSLLSCKPDDVDNTGALDSLGGELLGAFKVTGTHRTSFYTPHQSFVTLTCDASTPFESWEHVSKLSQDIRNAFEKLGYEIKLHTSAATVGDGRRSSSGGIDSFIAEDYGDGDCGYSIGRTEGSILGSEKFTSTTVGFREGMYVTGVLIFTPDSERVTLTLTK